MIEVSIDHRRVGLRGHTHRNDLAVVSRCPLIIAASASAVDRAQAKLVFERAVSIDHRRVGLRGLSTASKK